MQTIGLVLAALAGVAIAVVGLFYLIRPRAMAATFGLPVLPQPEADPWLRLKGVRDLVTGIVAGVLLLVAPEHVIGWVLLAFTLIPVGDAATILLTRDGRTAIAWGVHGSTAALMLLGALALLLG